MEEIRQAASALAPLLAGDHPARAIVRNLFRLARLAGSLGNETAPRTEVDMAETWWKTADGKLGRDHRERARLLRALAEQSLSSSDPMDVGNHPAGAVDALLASETLRDLGSDRVAFRHDVLREWAIANLLYSYPTRIEQLPLDRLAPAAFARGIELASRMALERSADDQQWQSIIDRLSGDDAHGSWRRAALLAPVRSEVADEVLKRATDTLIGDHAAMLRELIRTVMAVDVIPASTAWANAGIDPTIIPPSLNIPNKASWWRLILWLFSLGEALPASVIPDVVDLYCTWSSGLLGQDDLTPYLNKCLFRWLSKIEAARYGDVVDRAHLFDGELSHDQIISLESDLRTGFLMFCHRNPELTQQYVETLVSYANDYQLLRSIFRFYGTLPQAAPQEFVELIIRSLIPKAEPDGLYHREHDGPFGMLDLEFHPVSATKGPCWELLVHAPEHGLALTQRLADHAIAYYTHGRDPGDDRITVALLDGERSFPWTESYRWSREPGGHYCLTHGLLALEAWGRRRIEQGETFGAVLADVLGPSGSPAAFLLVAVDLILSHWPESREAAIPFVACPELLCIDQQRWMVDYAIPPSYLGFAPDPSSIGDAQSTVRLTSRRVTLHNLLDQYGVYGPADLREKLSESLRVAAERLGLPSEGDDLGDPAFMAAHALNKVDPNNYQEVLHTSEDDTQRAGMKYVSPPDECLHFEALQEARQAIQTDLGMQNRLRLALEDESSSSLEFAAVAVEWARGTGSISENDDHQETQTQIEPIVTAAMIAMRDGSDDLRSRNFEWALSMFGEALQAEENPSHRVRSGLHFNPIAIAFVGMTHALKHRYDAEVVRALLEVAGHDDPAAAHGFGVAAPILAAIDVRLPRSVLRCALGACVRPAREWGTPGRGNQKRFEPYRKRIQALVDAEIAWLADMCSEPDWPEFAGQVPRNRLEPRIVLESTDDSDPATPNSRVEETTDHHAVALWLRNAQCLADVQKNPWIRDLAQTYFSWTMIANGKGLGEHTDMSDAPLEWNDAYFDLLARCMPGLSLAEGEELALAPITSLPDEPFFDVMTPFLKRVDVVYFDDGAIDDAVAVGIRKSLAVRLTASRNWQWLKRDQSLGIEMHLGAAIATLFFNVYGYGQPSKCYLSAPAVDRLSPFFSILDRLIVGGPSLYVAAVTLNLFEVSPRPEHLSLLVSGAESWLGHYANRTDFWVEQGIGHRVCGLIGGIAHKDPAFLATSHPLRPRVDRILAALVSLGIPDAKRLEETLPTEPG